ncbi:hypothetical protein MT378_20425 [Psychrobacter sp. 16-Bac2893]
MAQFLENPPVQAMSLVVLGMPVGSPSMEYQDKFEPYQIMQRNKDGIT